MRISYAPLLAAPLIAAILLVAAPAMAQTTTSTVPPPNLPAPMTNAPKGEQGPGIDSANAVNPAPGAGEHPYVGHSENAFYNVEQRIGRVEQRTAALIGAQKRKAMAGLKSIKAELATQEARHGEVRDWDREHLNKRLDALEASVGIGAAAATAGE